METPESEPQTGRPENAEFQNLHHLIADFDRLTEGVDGTDKDKALVEALRSIERLLILKPDGPQAG